MKQERKAQNLTLTSGLNNHRLHLVHYRDGGHQR